jgi:hypothetical protein
MRFEFSVDLAVHVRAVKQIRNPAQQSHPTPLYA